MQLLTGYFHIDDVCQSTTSCSSRSRLSKMHSPYPYLCCCLVLSLVTGSDCFKPLVYPAHDTDQCEICISLCVVMYIMTYVSHSLVLSYTIFYCFFTICVYIYAFAFATRTAQSFYLTCHFNLICTCTCICHIVKCFSEARIILKHISMHCYISLTKDVWARVYTERHASMLRLSFFWGYIV